MIRRICLFGLLFCGVFSGLCGAESSPAELLAQGRRYFFGEDGKTPNPTLGAYYYRKAAEAGNVRAQYNFGACCEHGWGVSRSLQLAYFWYCRAAEQELPEAVIAKSRLLFNGLAPEKHEQQDFPALAPDRETALALLRKTSAAGSGEAARILAANLCLLLGEHPEYGQEIHAQAALAVQRLPRDIESKLLLATVYQNGIGGFFKPDLAVALLEQAAQLGSFEAKSRLAEALEYGHGCEMDPARSLKLDQEAAQHQVPRALLRMGRRFLYGNAVEQDHAKAVAYFQSAFASAYPGSARMLGNCFRDGLGVEQDYAAAAAFYELEAKAQDAASLYELGNLCRDGLGVEQDFEKAALCYHQAAQLDYAPAQRELALALISGRGVKKNVIKAAELLQLAARSGDRQAAEILQYNQLEY